MENMRKIVILCQMSVVCTHAWEFWKVPSSFTDTELDNLAQERAENNAEMYGFSSYPNLELEDGEEDEDYDDNIGGSWYDYDADKHDGYRVGEDDSWNEL